MLRVEGVSVRFGGVNALLDVTLQAEASMITGLIGPNGAGKTTLFNVISGLQRIERGRVLLDEVDITKLSPRRRARLGIARTFQRLEIFGSMTVRQNIQVAAELHRSWSGSKRNPKAVTEELLTRLNLTTVADVQAANLPTGLSRLVELGRTLATEPSVLLLDEPSSGLSTEESAVLGDDLTELAKSGIAILLVEHDMELVMRVSEVVWVLETGVLIASGPPAGVQANPAVRLAYLGPEVADGPDVGGEGRPLAPVVVQRHADAPVSKGTIPPVPALALSGIRASYGSIEAVHGVDLSVPAGSVVALLGPNGAGKSTLLKVASGRLRPTKGSVVFKGDNVTRWVPERLTRAGVCTVPEGRGVFPNLTVAENLSMWTFSSRGVRRGDVEERAFAHFPILAERRNQAAGTLSGGEQQMLAMSRALSTNPQLLLLDEISMGLAPVIVAALYEVVAQLASEGIAILLVEESAHTALSVADHAAVMASGRIVLTGTPAEVADAVFDAYLGPTPTRIRAS